MVRLCYICQVLFILCIFVTVKYSTICFITVPDEVSTLQFDEISDRAVKVVWSPPKQNNGILTQYRLKYRIKDSPKTIREELLPANITSIKINNLEVGTLFENLNQLLMVTYPILLYLICNIT